MKKWLVRLEITVNESKEEGISRLNQDGTEMFCKHGYVWRLPIAIRYFKKKYPEMKYRVVFFPKIQSFFSWLGRQNDYLFPYEGCEPEYAEGYPFKKAHLWKTRIGFKTAWQLSSNM